MAIKSKSLERGPRWLRVIINAIREDVIANRPLAGTGTTVSETDSGIAINASNSPGSPANPGGGDTLPDPPTDDGTYVLAIDVVDGVAGDPYWIGTDVCS